MGRRLADRAGEHRAGEHRVDILDLDALELLTRVRVEGVLEPGLTQQLAGLARHDDVAPVLTPFIERYWSVSGDRGGQPAWRSQVLTHPSMNVLPLESALGAAAVLAGGTTRSLERTFDRWIGVGPKWVLSRDAR